MRTLVVILLALAGCTEDTLVEDEGEELADLDGKADSATIPLRFLPGELFVSSAAIQTEVRKVFETEAELEATLGIDNPGIDFSREWGVFYAPGSTNPALTRGAMARIDTVALSSTGLTLKVTTSLEQNGVSCPDRRTRPFLLVAIAIPEDPPVYVKFYRADRTRTCAAAQYFDGVPFTEAQVAGALRACNTATAAQLSGAGITGSPQSILVAGRTWSSLSLVASKPGIGEATMLKLRTLSATF